MCIPSTHQYKTMLFHEDEEQCEVETVGREMCSAWRDRCSVEGHGGTGVAQGYVNCEGLVPPPPPPPQLPSAERL